MRTMKVGCDACYGFGSTERTTLQEDGRFHSVKTPCSVCGGKGYFEYALFEIEEAKELLKRCGMENET